MALLQNMLTRIVDRYQGSRQMRPRSSKLKRDMKNQLKNLKGLGKFIVSEEGSTASPLVKSDKSL